MRQCRVWAKELGLATAVVEGAREEPETGALVVTVRLGWRDRDRCGLCRRRCPGFDRGEGPRGWRALDLGSTVTWLEAESPRVSCPEHGVVVTAVPWARHVAGNLPRLWIAGALVSAMLAARPELATCSYQAFKPEMGHAVRITRGAPRYKLGYELAGSVMELAPTWPEWQIGKSGDSHAFVAAYQARLTQLGVANLSQRLQAGFPTRRLILLCFESLDGLSEPERILFCHRRAFADFWQRGTGDELPELSDQNQP